VPQAMAWPLAESGALRKTGPSSRAPRGCGRVRAQSAEMGVVRFRQVTTGAAGQRAGLGQDGRGAGLVRSR